MGYKVSVIVPVYNGENYVMTCCEQLISQTLKEINIIFVDDGSTDNSRALIDECTKKYSNVIGLHQKNQGVSVARNVGLNHASGEYYGFVDVDDNIDIDMFAVLYDTAKINHLDIISMEPLGGCGDVTLFMDKEKWITAFFQSDINMSACNKLFSQKVVSNEMFPPGKRIHEDLHAVYNALLKAEYVGCINVDKYHYIRIEGSSSRVPVFTDKYFDAINIADSIYDDVIARFPGLKDKAEMRKARTYLRITKIYYMRKAPREYRGHIDEIRRYLKSLPKNKIPTYYIRNDVIRYYLYLYVKPLFLLLIKTVDRN